jgi:hypothetical protein
MDKACTLPLNDHVEVSTVSVTLMVTTPLCNVNTFHIIVYLTTLHYLCLCSVEWHDN